MTALETLFRGVKRLYLDANIFVYFVEANDEPGQAAAQAIQVCRASQIKIVTSGLTIAECLHRPYSQGQDNVANLYEELFMQSGSIELISPDTDVFFLAARIGAEFNMRVPDAVHVATALFYGCDAIFTNDKRMRAPKPLRIIGLADV